MEFKILAFLIVLCHSCGIWQTVSSAQNPKEKWTEPNAWAKEVEVNSVQASKLDNGFCMCNAGESTDAFSDNQAAILIFKKFIRYLFNREKLEYDEHFSLYQRELLFTVLPAQLEKLEQLSDPRDLDSVLTEIFGNARTPNKYNRSNGTWSSIFALIWDILKDLVMLLRFSEVRFFSFVLLFIMVVWFVHRRHNVGLIIVIFGGFIVFGYFVTYLECNRELEIKQMLEVIEKNEATKPSEPRWYTPITNWFSSSSEEVAKTERREQIKKASKLNLTFCRPDHVFMLYANELFLKQLEFLLEKCTQTLTSLQSTLSFPYNYIAAIGLLVMIGYIIKLTFKYILNPSVWTGYFNRSQTTYQSPHPNNQQLPHNDDRISGENLRTLLNAFKTPNVYVNNSTLPIGSCVQEVSLEPLEALKQQSDNSSNSSNSNNNSNISDTPSLKSEASEKNSPQQSSCSSLNTSMETVAAELTAMSNVSEKSDADFVLISQVEKVTLEDLPND